MKDKTRVAEGLGTHRSVPAAPAIVYNAMDVFVLPSGGGGFGLQIRRALKCWRTRFSG